MIPTFFNGMIAILLANWALNDLPHAAGLLGSRYGEPATPGQIQYIAVLCQQLKITTPYEERMRTFGEAGRMIRELEAEREHRKKLGSGNPGVILTPISPAEPHVLDITYRGEPMVGTLTTYTEGDSLVVYELAADEPGVVSKEFLFALGNALEAIAKQKGLVSIKIKYFPQHLKMYELAGFTQSYEEGEASLVVRHVDGNPDTVRETPFLPIGVWFDSPKIEAEVKSAPGLLEYIGSSLGELGQKYGTRPKSIGFAKVGVEDLAVHVWSDVIFNVVFVDLWLMDEERTRQVLKYLIPHEFGHHMMAVEHVKIPLPKGPKWKEARTKYKEKYADEFAERESGMTREQVNTLTGELGIEWEHKEQPETGNPTTLRIERTTVDKIIDDLERTWHRIDSDMSIRMQSALGILKEVMGHYYEEPCIVAWGNGDLVGIAVYETFYNKDLSIGETDLKELASFSYEPGIGKALVEEVIKIGREENSDIVSASYGPGAREFYEKLGFVQNTYYPQEPTLMMYKLKNTNPDTAVGTCYPDAWRYLIREEEGYLVHGSVQMSAEGPRVNHAWVELPTGYVWEPQTGQYFTIEGFKIMSPIEEHRYTDEEAAIMVARSNNHGPWTDEERAQWIR